MENLSAMSNVNSQPADFPEVTTYGNSTGDDSSGSDQAEMILYVIQHTTSILVIPPTLFNLVVFLHKDMRSATAVYVIGLSVAQLVYVLGFVVQRSLYWAIADPFRDELYWLYNEYARVYCGNVVRRVSYVITCLVSLERLYAIARPLHVKTFFLSRRPVTSTLLAYVITALLHVYLLTKSEIKAVGDPATGTVVYFPGLSNLYFRHKQVNDAFSFAAKVVLTYCGLLTQMVLNVLMVCFLKRHTASSQQLTQSAAKEEASRQRERQLTVTILATSVCYLVLSLPLAMHYLVYTIYPQDYAVAGKYEYTFAVVDNITYSLSIFSCGIDFVCFMVLSSNYRRTFHKLFARCCITKPADTAEPSTKLDSLGSSDTG